MLLTSSLTSFIPRIINIATGISISNCAIITINELEYELELSRKKTLITATNGRTKKELETRIYFLSKLHSDVYRYI